MDFLELVQRTVTRKMWKRNSKMCVGENEREEGEGEIKDEGKTDGKEERGGGAERERWMDGDTERGFAAIC